jgi:hypothetical protein
MFSGIALAYLLAAYLVFPWLGKEKALRHPDLLDGARLTHTANGMPGDPLNLSLVGSEGDVVRAMDTAGWNPAGALGFRSDMKIAIDTVTDRPDIAAPVSNLFLYGRKEDLAFEKPIGHSPRERHHVRFWRSDKVDDGRPIWFGSATHDVGVELSRTTGQVTHRIAPELDTERDMLLSELAAVKQVASLRWIDGYHKELQGRNGGGDPWFTDGRMPVATLAPTQQQTGEPDQSTSGTKPKK